MRDEDFNAAEMLNRLYEITERQKNASDSQNSGVTVLRSVSDTADTSDTVSATSTTNTGWDWSENSTWGMDTW